MRCATRPRPGGVHGHARRFVWLAVGVLGCGLEPAQGQVPPARKPATVEEAAQVLDLETFPLLDGADEPGERRMASLFYQAKGEVRKAYDFQKQALVAKGWKELPDPYVTDESASGTFTKDGFVTSVSVSPGDARKPGTVQVMIAQHGNLDLAKLPVPPDAKPLYAGPATALFVTGTSRDDAAKATRERLIAQGWQPYGTAGDSLIFKQNALRLNAMISTAPAQGGKTMIQYSSELMSADLPAPRDAVQVHYADSTKGLEFDARASSAELADFYRDVLGQAGWKPTTENPVKTGAHEVLIFRNPRQDILTLEFSPVEDVLRGTLRHQSASEVAQQERRAREALVRKQAAAQPNPAAKPTVTLRLPAEARNVKAAEDDIEFTLATGKAKAAVETLCAQLREAGWKEDAASLQGIAGAVSLSKKGTGILTIIYTDTGLMPAEIHITAFGAVIERKAGAK
jgi:hypothetical protein